MDKLKWHLNCVRKIFFTHRHWKMIPKEAVDDPTLDAFKVRMDWMLDSLIW